MNYYNNVKDEKRANQIQNYEKYIQKRLQIRPNLEKCKKIICHFGPDQYSIEMKINYIISYGELGVTETM